jgi:glycogen debranching enzyme
MPSGQLNGGRPVLGGGHAAGAHTLPRLYAAALHNLLDLNTVPGRTAGEPDRYIRAGGGYSDPWTRDTAINAWGGGSVLEPDVARDTLLMVCGRAGDGRRIIAQDNQWWDQIIWVIAAWHHYLCTGDKPFLAEALQIGVDSLAILDRDRFRPSYGLYAGGAVMQDGIAGYPSPPSEPGNPSTFVLDYPEAHEIMCLSTNAVYVGALRALAGMAAVLDGDPAAFEQKAARLSSAINEHLWIEEIGRYGYFVHGTGRLVGTLDRHEEAAGLAFALMFGIADDARRARVLAGAHREPHGVVSVWPHFRDRFSDEFPGRHNVICWPMVMGMWGDAAARVGHVGRFDETLGDLEQLFSGSDDSLFEVYNAGSGEVDGGWQLDVHWPSEPDQTWSATALLRLVHEGLFGVRYEPAGLRFAPTVPARFDGMTLTGFPYRGALLDVTVVGSGSRLDRVLLDGVEVGGDDVVVPGGATGRYAVSLHVV